MFIDRTAMNGMIYVSRDSYEDRNDHYDGVGPG